MKRQLKKLIWSHKVFLSRIIWSTLMKWLSTFSLIFLFGHHNPKSVKTCKHLERATYLKLLSSFLMGKIWNLEILIVQTIDCLSINFGKTSSKTSKANNKTILACLDIWWTSRTSSVSTNSIMLEYWSKQSRISRESWGIKQFTKDTNEH